MNSDPLITYRHPPGTLDRSVLESFAEILATRVARGHTFHCRITSDAELRSLNRTFLGQDRATDVLSFPGVLASPGGNGYLGDIAISLERARAQAREWGHKTEDEIRILMLHGVLHLKGMDHDSDSGEMARTESRWRRRLGLAAGLIERGAQ
jgi:probable rRNA maturation factor